MMATRHSAVLVAVALTTAMGGCANFRQTGQPERIWPYPEPPVVETDRDARDEQPRTTATRPDRVPTKDRPGARQSDRTDQPVADPADGAAPQADTPLPPYAGPRSLRDTAGPAALSLAEEAARQRAQGDLPGAASQLERALRIEPRNPFLWLLLANVQLEQSQTDQARQMARRARSLASDNPYVTGPAWRIAEAAWRAEGQAGEADDARQRAEQAELRQTS